MEQSYVMVKPEFANNKKVIKEIIKRIKALNLNIIDSKYIRYTAKDAQRHYSEHVGKSFYPYLETYITSDKAFGMIVEGENSIAKIRAITKDIRTDIPVMLGIPERKTENVIHASDCVSSAINEIEIFKSLPNIENGLTK